MEDSFITLLRKNPGKAFMIAVVFLGMGGWIAYAELSHAQGRGDHKTVEQLVQIQRDAAIEKKAEAEQQKQLREYIKKGCLLGTNKNKDDCAAVGIKIP